MSDHLSVSGTVGTQPQLRQTANGHHVVSFRLATAQGYFDRRAGKWHQLDSNWFDVSCFRQLAEHVASSLNVGDRIVVSGSLRVKPWSKEERSGLNVEIEADAVGHDLRWGTSVFTRALSSAASAEPSDTAEPFLPEHAVEHWPDAPREEVA